jgi:5'-deoxynucleotidase YfbR-like HD superfamily hydrolase
MGPVEKPALFIMNKKLVTRVLQRREACHIKRCHTIFTNDQTYTVGAHTCNMLQLLDLLHPCPSLNLFKAILRHDLHERWIGDLPGSIRSVDPELKAAYNRAAELVEDHYETRGPALTEGEKKWLKGLDALDFWLWAVDEMNAGNDHVMQAMNWTEKWFSDNVEQIPREIGEFYARFEWRRTQFNE